MRIHLLSDDIINKIAAGEVVERPASVIKELVENSIDAGADKIEIVYEDGGKSYIKVSDNGSGIPQEELPLAVTRHATSKVTQLEDLEKIGSMGFRGEALASISSVARVRLQSRTRADEFGYRIEVVSGEKLPITKVGMPQGTEIIVQELFASIPARKKFLKTDQTESKHIVSIITGFALAHPAIEFIVQSGKKQIMHVSRVSTVQERIASLWDRETVDQLHEIFYEHPHATVRGFVGSPK